MKQKNSFTLIELLVVIAIIGLLASIVVLSVQRAAISSRDSRRKADVLTIKNALEQYANAHNGMYPYAPCHHCEHDSCPAGERDHVNDISTAHSADCWYFSASSVPASDVDHYPPVTVADALKPYLDPLPHDPKFDPNDFSEKNKFIYIGGNKQYSIWLTNEKDNNSCVTGPDRGPINPDTGLPWWTQCSF